MRRAPAIVLMLLAFVPSGAEAAGAIKGTLWHSARARATHERRETTRRGLFAYFRPKATTAPVARIPLRSDLRDAVVSVRSLPPDAARRLNDDLKRARHRPEAPVLGLADGRLEPRVVAVAAGSRVAVRNTGRLWHGAFSVAAARTFDLGKLRPGAVDSLTFDRPGLATVHCDLHPREIGYVLVLPNPAFTRPDAYGRFTLPKLPPGTYQVAVWHPERGTMARRVEVPRRGDAKCDLVF